jgi:predicted amidophosphoribosyltransferase
MLHKSGMATEWGDADSKTSRRAESVLHSLRRAGRAIVDYALPPRCPACGTIVEADRQFCLICWSSLDFLDGPACARCSVPLPLALPGTELECGACLADPPPFEGAPAAVA